MSWTFKLCRPRVLDLGVIGSPMKAFNTILFCRFNINNLS